MILPLARVLSGSAGVAAFRAVAPLYAGIAVVASVLFGPQGMSATDAVGSLESSLPLRLGLWGAWLVAATPAARLLFETPDTFYLRALPVARWRFWLVHATHLAGLHLPWIALHLRGGGWRTAAAATCVTVGAQALLCARSLRWPEAIAAALLLVATALARDWEIPAGVLAAAVGIHTAFRRAPERSSRRRSSAIRGSAVVALATSYLLVLPRRAPAALVRAVALTATGAAFAVLVARNNQMTDDGSIIALSLGVLAFFQLAGAGGLHRGIRSAEEATGWILDSTGTRPAIRRAAAGGAIALCTSGCGLLHGVGVALGLGARPALTAALIALGAAGAAVSALVIMGIRRR